MKHIIILFLTCLILTSCKIKTQTTSTTDFLTEKKVENIVKSKLDSFSKTIKVNESISESKLNEVVNSAKKEITVQLDLQKDSLGNILPAKYQNIVNGVIRESLEVQGGKVQYKVINNDTATSKEAKTYEKDIEYLYSVLEYQKEQNEILNDRLQFLEAKKETKVKTYDFSIWIYILTGVVSILTIGILILFFYFKNQLRAILSLL